MAKSKGKTKVATQRGPSMALWGSSVRSRSRPPLLSIPSDVNILEIPGEWEVLPAARMTENGPLLYRVLLRKSPKKFEQGLNGKKRRKSA
jgi:hypothetical protein